MELDSVKRSLEPTSGGGALPASGLPAKFYDSFVLHGLTIDLIEHSHIICSMTVPPRLLNSSGLLHSGLLATLVDILGSAVFYSAGCSTSGVSLEISMSYVDGAILDAKPPLGLPPLRQRRRRAFFLQPTPIRCLFYSSSSMIMELARNWVVLLHSEELGFFELEIRRRFEDVCVEGSGSGTGFAIPLIFFFLVLRCISSRCAQSKEFDFGRRNRRCWVLDGFQ